MDIRQLRGLLGIAETGSVTRAAEMLHIVQPALSRQLKLLGATLFERGRRGMRLTEAGQLLAERARRALRELDQAKAEIVAAPGTVSGSVAIGLLPSIVDLLAGPLVKALKERYPALSVRVSIGFAGYLQTWLESGEIDVALLYDPKPSAVLEVEPILDEALFLVGPPGAGLRPDRPVPLRDIAAIPLVLPSRPHGLRVVLDHACGVAGVHVTVVAETNSMNIQKNLIHENIGFTILPSVAVFEDLRAGRLSAAPITAPDLRRRIVLATPMTRRTSLAVSSAAAELRSVIKAVRDRQGWPGAIWLAAN